MWVVQDKSPLLFFYVSIPSFPTAFILKKLSFLCCVLVTLVKDCDNIETWLMVDVPVFISIPYCVDYYSFVILLKSEKIMSPALFFLLKLLWLLKVFFGSQWILELLLPFLRKLSLGFLWRLYWICRLFGVEWTFSNLVTQFVNVDYLCTYLRLPQFLSLRSYSF